MHQPSSHKYKCPFCIAELHNKLPQASFNEVNDSYHNTVWGDELWINDELRYQREQNRIRRQRVG